MTDIYDIKDIVLGFPINIINSLIFLLFIFILFILFKILKKQSNKIIKQKKEVFIPKEKKDFYKIIKQFKKEHINDNFDRFYSGLLSILRDILEDKGYKNITNMTFKEISSLDINLKLIQLIQSIYFKEYKKKVQDNIDIRNDYIKDIIKLIK